MIGFKMKRKETFLTQIVATFIGVTNADGPKGAFTQSVLRGVIRRRLGYVIDKKYFFHLKNNHFTPRNTPWCERYLRKF